MTEKTASVALIRSVSDAKAISTCESVNERLSALGVQATSYDAESFGARDLLASERLVLAAYGEPKVPYAELARICEGINLAGRKIGLIGSKSALLWFQSMLEPTDASIVTKHEGVVDTKGAQSIAHDISE